LELFEATWKTFGIIHAVLSNAGVSNENFLRDEVDPNTGKLLPPNIKIMDVNLTGTIYVAKCAVHYFGKWPELRSQLVMTGSAASFFDTPPLHLYCASKAGILGFMRSLRTQLIKNNNVTVNMVAPWMTSRSSPMLMFALLCVSLRRQKTHNPTVTSMLPQAIRDRWGTLPANETWGVAHAILLPVVRPDVNGKSLFVAGHQIVDFEDKLLETQPLWMGEQLSKDMNEGQKIMIP
jgi:NAD(P)-dependent dehydrogenase (short-subunit alcohol dehydrogenase family)